MARISGNIPGTPSPGRMNNIGGVQLGVGNISADDIGGAAVRQLGEFGRALTQFGTDGMHVAIQKMNKQAEGDAFAAINEAQGIGSSFRREAEQAKGDTAREAYDNYEQKYGQERARIRDSLTTNTAKEIFDRSMRSFDFNSRDTLQRHVSREIEAYNTQAKKASFTTFIQDAAAQPYNIGYIGRVMDTDMPERIRDIYSGAPQEFIDLEIENARMGLIEDATNNIISGGGKALEAVAFLNTGIGNSLKSEGALAKFKNLKTKYQLATLDDAEKEIIDRYAQEGVRRVAAGEDASEVYRSMLMNPDLSGEQADKAFARINRMAELENREEARRESALAKEEKAAEKRTIRDQRVALREKISARIKGGESIDEIEADILSDPDLAEEVRKSSADLFRAKDREQKAKKVSDELDRDAELDAELKEAGFHAQNMKSFNVLSTEEQNKWIKRGNTRLTEAKTKKDPNLNLYLDLNALTDEELVTRWNDTDARDADLDALGGFDSQWGKEQLKRVTDMQAGGGNVNPKIQGIDDAMNIMRREINAHINDTGRTFSNKEKREAFVSRSLNSFVRKSDDYMREHKLTHRDQIPLRDRDRMRAEVMVSYYVNTPGRIYGTNETQMTLAEADVAGQSVEGRRVVPQSLPRDLRRNYVGGDVRITPMGDINAVVASDVPIEQAPPMVVAATHNVGGDAVITRELTTGDWIVVGNDRAIPFNAEGQPSGETFDVEEIGRLQRATRRREAIVQRMRDQGMDPAFIQRVAKGQGAEIAREDTRR